MTSPRTPVSGGDQGVQPIDVLAGLGTADRQLLAVSLALFDDSTLSKRVQELIGKASDWVDRKLSDREVRQTARSVETRMGFWRDSKLSDDELRLTLWIYLREAFGLPARLTQSRRGAEIQGFELAAAAICAADPTSSERSVEGPSTQWVWREGERRYATLTDLVQAIVRELISTALAGHEGQMDRAAQDKLIAETRARLQGLTEADQRRMLESVGAQELNDAAVRKILLTGGGLTAFSTGVGIAGFSAYILAAQASAFIPLVSGPALVSTVAVLSNPITVVAATAAALWWFSSSTNNKVRTAVALRVVSLLALQGLSSGRGGIQRTLTSFAAVLARPAVGEISPETCQRYRTDWEMLTRGRDSRPRTREADPHVTEIMERPARTRIDGSGRLRGLLFPDRSEERTTAAVAGLTLGDLAYSAAAIDPAVINAADFSRVEALDDPLAFAAFADKIESLAPGAAAGSINNLKGYVAERIVAAELVAKGYQIEFPSSSNQEGWDLLVDGKPFQVKCLADTGALIAHFEKNPDIPVLLNAELVDQVPPEWAEKVFYVEGYSNELISEVTGTSLEAGADLLQPNVPIFALGVIAARNLAALQAGKVSAVQAAEQIAVDGGTRVGLAVVGGFLGKGIGLLVFGPAGALVLGTVVPVLSQAQARRARNVIDGWVKPESYRNWEDQAHRAIENLIERMNEATAKKLEILRRKYKAIDAGDVGDYIRMRLADDELFLHECIARLGRLQRSVDEPVEQRALAVIRWTAASTVHSSSYQTEIGRLKAMLEKRPPLEERIKEVTEGVAMGIKAGTQYTTAVVKGFMRGLFGK